MVMVQVVRPKQLKQLRSIPIWVEVDNSGDIECCCYHVSEEWLTEHKCVCMQPRHHTHTRNVVLAFQPLFPLRVLCVQLQPSESAGCGGDPRASFPGLFD